MDVMGLLDLPVELRLEIYNYIIDTDCDIELIKQSLCNGSEPRHRYITAWCNMMIVCRQLAHELKSYMDKNTSGERSERNTWTLHLSTTFTASRLPAVMKLPCSPSQLKAVHVIIPSAHNINMHAVPYDIDCTLNRLVRFGPRWTPEKALGCPLSFDELILSFPFSDWGIPFDYHREEVVVLAFSRMQKRWSEGRNPLIEAFNKVTVVTQEYEQSWLMGEQDRKSVQGFLYWMVSVCSGQSR